MYAALDNPPLYELYEFFNEEIKWMLRNRSLNTFPIGKSLIEDQIFKLLLENNGCALSDDPIYHENTFKFNENYKLVFMYKAIGNTVNECFDYIEFYGTKYFIIFMDKFIDIDRPLETEDDIFMGKSLYIEMIRKIVDAFLATIVNFAELNSSVLSTTSAGNAYRFAGVFIAASIVRPFCHDGDISDNDIDVMDPEELKEMLKLPLALLLSGIKYTN